MIQSFGDWVVVLLHRWGFLVDWDQVSPERNAGEVRDLSGLDAVLADSDFDGEVTVVV